MGGRQSARQKNRQAKHVVLDPAVHTSDRIIDSHLFDDLQYKNSVNSSIIDLSGQVRV